MARTVRTPGATEEPTTEQVAEVIDPVTTQSAADSVEDEQASDSEPTTEQVDQSILLEILSTQKRIEEKLDALAEQAGVKVKNKKRLKFVEGQGYVREQ